MQAPDKLLFLDLETTGLDPHAIGSAVLEVAAVVVYAKPLDEIESFEARIDPGYFALDSKYVLDMHIKSGLLLDGGSGSGLVRSGAMRSLEAESRVVSLIDRHWEPEEPKPILAGNSIHFDRRWADVHMPSLSRRLNYRMLDVTTLKIECAIAKLGEPPKRNAHRAMSDVRESIEELRWCREALAARYR